MAMSAFTKKILWLIIDNGAFGGIESHVFNLSCALKKRGLSICVVFLHNCRNQPLDQHLKQAGITTQHFETPIAFAKALQHHRPDLLHTHGYKPSILSKLLGHCLGIPVLSTYHSGERGEGRIRLYHWFDKQLSPLSTNIAVSHAILKTLKGNRNHFIPNFVSLATQIAKSYTFKKKCLFVGRISHEKGPDLFATIASKMPDIAFHMIGDGPMLKQLPKLDNLIPKGATPMNHSIYQDYDLVCLSSREEGLPLTALEAMAAGIPVVAFAVGGLPNLIQQGKNGFIAPPLDMDAFIDNIQTFANWSDEKRKRMGKAAYQTVQQHYTTEACLNNHLLPLYQHLLGIKLISK